MSSAESRRARGVFCLFAAVEFFTPVILVALLVLALSAPVSGMLEEERLADKLTMLGTASWRVTLLIFAWMVADEVTKRCESSHPTPVRFSDTRLLCCVHWPLGCYVSASEIITEYMELIIPVLIARLLLWSR